VKSFRPCAFGALLLPLLLAAPLAAQTAQEGAGAPADTEVSPFEERPPAPEDPAETPAAEIEPPAEPSPGPAVAEPVPPAAEPAEPPAIAAPAPAAEPAPPPAVAAPVEPVQPTPPPVIAAPAPPPPPPPPLDPKDVKLKVASPGGAYMKSQERSYFQPFGKRTGYSISAVAYDGSLAALRSQAGSPVWDVVDLDQEVVAQGCQEGLLEPVDAAIAQPGPDGTPPVEDFLPGAFQSCGIANVAWSAVIIHDRGLKTAPTKVEHFFDLKRYPGKRALPRTPQHTLELALLADNVAPHDVYAQLATKEGLDRAFAKLNTIKAQIVWWDKPREAIERVARKQAAMGLAFNGRAFMAQVKERQPIAMIWDHQIYHLNYWAIPKGAKFAAQAKEFIGFATTAGPMADQTRLFPYGPARLSAVRLAGKHADINLDMKAFLPTHQPNLQGALAYDGVWWTAQEQAVKERFAAWLEGREIGNGESGTSQ
jgi:putative spermidine/putrescine transport system substrate-binding protein